VISEDGQKAAQESAGSAPISDALREKAKAAIDSIKVAS
jgi:phosphate transport system substrate-binding protein